MSHIQPPGQWSVPVSSHFPWSALLSLHSVPLTELLHAHDGTGLDKQPRFLVMKTSILCRGMPQISVFSGLRLKDHELSKINEFQVAADSNGSNECAHCGWYQNLYCIKPKGKDTWIVFFPRLCSTLRHISTEQLVLWFCMLRNWLIMAPELWTVNGGWERMTHCGGGGREAEMVEWLTVVFPEPVYSFWDIWPDDSHPAGTEMGLKPEPASLLTHELLYKM